MLHWYMYMKVSPIQDLIMVMTYHALTAQLPKIGSISFKLLVINIKQ